MVLSATNEDVSLHAVEDTAAVVLPDPLTVEGVPFRRSNAGKFSGGLAAASHSDMFKHPDLNHKPLSKRWDHRLSAESKSRQATQLKELAKYLSKPGMLSLGGGLPSSEYFPFEEIDVKVPALDVGNHEEITMQIGKHDVREGKSAYDLSIALNYGQGSGSAQMIRWVVEHTEIVHNPPYRDWGCTLTPGSTCATEHLYRMFLEKGDYVISEEFTFATAVETSGPLGCRFIGVRMDDEGMIPSALDELLTTWDPISRGARKPFLVYTVPSGQNPSGATMGLERRKEFYKIAQKHDLIILEDEPYYFLQMQPYVGSDHPSPPAPKTHKEFLDSLVPSLLSMDVDGRIVRLDSFSKVLSPGSRTGWITASAQLIERFTRHNEVSVQHPSGISQIILHRLLDETWGHGGYLDWLIHLRMSYTERRNVLMKACEEHLPKEIASWTPPAAGMFHWIKLEAEKHPMFGKKSVKEIEDEILETAVQEGVLVVPGSYFKSEARKPLEARELYVRANFASAEFEQMTEATRRLGVALRKSFGLKE
ncbi:aromatic amino acid aminotransferas-like protein [Ascodesmis nigricans]|uniref:aromatic-amino-acid transaminase n=1 Tax=Ascodesmis nigricans TaxID=341454 RepID=A0A4S2N6Z7_9PEZI|nr:aromatic amino acid aminotransferas-like protein [Ascodesmis nigricans]